MNMYAETVYGFMITHMCKEHRKKECATKVSNEHTPIFISWIIVFRWVSGAVYV